MSQEPSLTSNRLLTALPEDEYQRLEPYLTSISLAAGTILYEASDRIKTVYFPNSALISLVYILANGATTEIGLIGGTGMIGLPAILSNGYSNHRAIVQVAGSAIKVSAAILKQEFDRGEKLQRLLLDYAQTRIDQVAQLAVCNRHHIIEERLARWLLMVSDLTQSNELLLTQELLGDMLGVRRSGVTVSAGTLQQAGMIRYSRGKIIILNREELEQTACECYELFRDNFYRF
jgi:CRP-like cAMP-binding protein